MAMVMAGMRWWLWPRWDGSHGCGWGAVVAMPMAKVGCSLWLGLECDRGGGMAKAQMGRWPRPCHGCSQHRVGWWPWCGHGQDGMVAVVMVQP